MRTQGYRLVHDYLQTFAGGGGGGGWHGERRKSLAPILIKECQGFGHHVEAQGP